MCEHKVRTTIDRTRQAVWDLFTRRVGGKAVNLGANHSNADDNGV
jgi:hypothetical protein